MKNLLFVILLTFTNVISSQITVPTPKSTSIIDSLKISPSQVDSVYIGLQQNIQLKKEDARLKRKARELDAIVQDQNNETQQLLDEIKRLNTAIDDKQKEYLKKSIELLELKEKKKQFSIGPAAIITVDGKIFGGAAVVWSLFRF